MLRQALNLPLPFPREFYAANILCMLALRYIYLHGLCGYVISNLKAVPLLSKSARTIFTHVNARLDKFLDALVVIVLVFVVLVIALAFGVLAKFAWTTRGSSDKTMKAVRSGKASYWNTPASFGNSIEGPNASFRYNVSWFIYNRNIVCKFPFHTRFLRLFKSDFDYLTYISIRKF